MAHLGVYMCLEDNTKNKTNMGVTRFVVRTKYILVLNETFNVQINEYVFWIKVVEDSQGPLKFCLTWNHEELASSLESLSEASFDEGLDDDMSLASKEGDENDILEYIVQK